MAKKSTQLSGVKEIARRAKVSIGTVDRVIHDRTGVSPKTKEKVKKIIAEMNYKPNLLGRILASKKTFRFASLIPKVSPETSFWEAPLKGIEAAEAEIRQYNVEVKKYFYDQNDKGSFVTQYRKILKEEVDGVLLAPSFIDESVAFTNQCKKLKIPYVFIDSDIPDQPSLAYIGSDLFHSGYLGADLSRHLIGKKDKILIINISKELDNHHHLLRKEEGFRAYFKNNGYTNLLMTIEIRKTDHNAIKKALEKVLAENNDIGLIFVTNSKVSGVASYLKETKKTNIRLIGYDFLKENIDFLNENIIDFMICHKPGEQAYRGIMALYKHLVLKLPVEENTFMPIDIIMKTNYAFYNN
ncbi:MAG TPA: LacI family DNA-binding transcriptional regulator [Agriterribacter sp.]|nr:LacI family DNA-binding transcriptional regulator [Agriterribacter sp.]